MTLGQQSSRAMNLTIDSLNNINRQTPMNFNTFTKILPLFVLALSMLTAATKGGGKGGENATTMSPTEASYAPTPSPTVTGAVIDDSEEEGVDTMEPVVDTPDNGLPETTDEPTEQGNTGADEATEEPTNFISTSAASFCFDASFSAIFMLVASIALAVQI